MSHAYTRYLNIKYIIYNININNKYNIINNKI